MAKGKEKSTARKQPALHPSNSRFESYSEEDSLYPPPVRLRHRSIPDLFLESAKDRDLEPFAQFRDVADYTWVSIKWRNAVCQVAQVATLLSERGVKKGDRVAIISSTRYEWIIADLAILSLGAVSVSVFQTLTAPEIAYILWDSSCSVLFVENEEQLEKLHQIELHDTFIPEREDFPGGPVQLSFTSVISFESISSEHFATRHFNYADAIANESGIEDLLSQLHKFVATVSREDIATLVYTSGTTGPPKGVISTHGNHLAMAEMVLLSGLMANAKGVFLYLPLAHSFARLIPLCIIASGGDLFLPTIVDKQTSRFEARQLLSDIAASSPSIVPSVPRIFEKIMTALSPASPRSKREKLIAWALRVRKQALCYPDMSQTPLGIQLRLFLAEIVLAKVRNKIFGNRLQYCVSGGAPISVETLEFFRALGIMIYEGYGLTETTPAMTANTPTFCSFGTVGRAFAGVEIRIAESDGEILVRGNNVSKGYWRAPKATAEAWSAEGWFATGDIGEFTPEGFLRITDRKKDLIVTAGGKKVPPALLEGKLKASSVISHALVFGERKPFLIALITLDEPHVREWAKNHPQLRQREYKQIIESAEIRNIVQSDINRINGELAGYEQIKRFFILAEDFSVENGLLSPSLKLKRKVATERYREQIETLYAEPLAHNTE